MSKSRAQADEEHIAQLARAFFNAATKESADDEDILPQEDGDDANFSVFHLFCELFPEVKTMSGKNRRLRLHFNKIGYQLYGKEQSRRVPAVRAKPGNPGYGFRHARWRNPVSDPSDRSACEQALREIGCDDNRIEKVKGRVQELCRLWDNVRRPSRPAGPGRPKGGGRTPYQSPLVAAGRPCWAVTHHTAGGMETCISEPQADGFHVVGALSCCTQRALSPSMDPSAGGPLAWGPPGLEAVGVRRDGQDGGRPWPESTFVGRRGSPCMGPVLPPLVLPPLSLDDQNEMPSQGIVRPAFWSECRVTEVKSHEREGTIPTRRTALRNFQSSDDVRETWSVHGCLEPQSLTGVDDSKAKSNLDTLAEAAVLALSKYLPKL